MKYALMVLVMLNTDTDSTMPNMHFIVEFDTREQCELAKERFKTVGPLYAGLLKCNNDRKLGFVCSRMGIKP